MKNSGFQASFAAICSAIVEVVNTSNVRINVDSVGAGAWQWLAYTICCGTSSIRSLTIWEATLMKSDITAIANVLKFCYPKPPSTLHSPEYGYVTIQEGAEIWPSGLTEGNDCPFILSSECRCRALFTGGGDVEIVIPGYGICRTKLGERISHETRDSHGMQFRTNLVCSTRSVTLYLNKVESVPLVYVLTSKY
ncbi:Hypothetical protein PHPALM_10293 [Phytophthora palmivora]|uniref:Uncharacterized protein n=1 Tax=Phytophthora palmivora TaxID=4796 RepID=A0A2P4Y560_9STRA|nr:Hypothetical protein PHPALM_10293 [Phytophthora palmivora]